MRLKRRFAPIGRLVMQGQKCDTFVLRLLFGGSGVTGGSVRFECARNEILASMGTNRERMSPSSQVFPPEPP